MCSPKGKARYSTDRHRQMYYRCALYRSAIKGTHSVYWEARAHLFMSLRYRAVTLCIWQRRKRPELQCYVLRHKPERREDRPLLLRKYKPLRRQKNLTQPVQIAQGALNYCIGTDIVHIRLMMQSMPIISQTVRSRKISADNTKALLCSVCGKDVIWYDTTDGTGGDVPDAIMHVQLP